MPAYQNEQMALTATQKCTGSSPVAGFMKKDAIEELEKWNSKHKARCCSIEIDDGYGATCWVVKLFGEKGKVHACETGYYNEEIGEPILISNEQEDYLAHYVETAASPKTLYVSCFRDKKDWPGLKRVILAAIDVYENKL